MPEIIWSYEVTSDALTRSRLMYRALRAWNLARKQGFKVHDVMYRGRPLTGRQVELCNLWIQGGGAATAQNLEHWEATNLFEGIIRVPEIVVEPLIETKPTLDLQA
jgi:hypothetical protein